MNKKAQLDEINPVGIIGGLLGGFLAVVTSKVEINIIFKILTFVFTTLVCYFMVNRMSNN